MGFRFRAQGLGVQVFRGGFVAHPKLHQPNTEAFLVDPLPTLSLARRARGWGGGGVGRAGFSTVGIMLRSLVKVNKQTQTIKQSKQIVDPELQNKPPETVHVMDSLKQPLKLRKP